MALLNRTTPRRDRESREQTSKPTVETDKSVSISDDELIDFTITLRDQTDAGVDVKEIFAQVATTATKKAFADAVKVMLKDLARGFQLSEVMVRYPNVFDSSYVALVMAAERSGKYTRKITATGTEEGIFDLLIEYIKRRNTAREHIKTALLYPAVVAGAVILAVIGMTTYILPTLKGLFDLLITNPNEVFFVTKMMFWICDFLTKFWWFVPVAVVGCGIMAWLYWQSDSGKALWEHYQLRLKIIGPLFVMLNQAEILILMGTLFSAGTPVPEILTILMSTVKNREIVAAIGRTKGYIEQGLGIADALKRAHWLFDNDVYAALSSAERAGRLGSTLQPFAIRRFERIDEQITRLVKFIEPALIVFGGVVVGFIAIGFYGGLSTLIKNMTH